MIFSNDLHSKILSKYIQNKKCFICNIRYFEESNAVNFDHSGWEHSQWGGLCPTVFVWTAILHEGVQQKVLGGIQCINAFSTCTYINASQGSFMRYQTYNCMYEEGCTYMFHHKCILKVI